MLGKTLIVIVNDKVTTKEQIGYIPGRMLLSKHQITVMMIMTTKMRIITKMMMRAMMMMRTMMMKTVMASMMRMTLGARWECKA